MNTDFDLESPDDSFESKDTNILDIAVVQDKCDFSRSSNDDQV